VTTADHEDAAQAARDYIAMEVGLVGDRDPAEVQAELPGRIEEILSEAGPDARVRPGPERNLEAIRSRREAART